jgi:threonine/homoserine/homoserine lactone efflux protein
LSLLAFVGVAAVVIVTPGPDTALTIRNSVVRGRRGGVATALGVSTGQLCWTVAASLGAVAVLRASQPAFTAVRLAGAAYLIWLGAQSLLAAVRGRPHAQARARRGAPYRQGLLSNLGNPKMAVFFASLLPQFGSSLPALLILGSLFALMTCVWLSVYAAVVPKLTRSLQRPLDALSGIALVALGGRLARS